MCRPVTSISLINFTKIFSIFLLCCHILWSLFRDVCFFLLVFAFAVVSPFTFVFISGQDFASSSNGTAATTAAVELI